MLLVCTVQPFRYLNDGCKALCQYFTAYHEKGNLTSDDLYHHNNTHWGLFGEYIVTSHCSFTELEIGERQSSITVIATLTQYNTQWYQNQSEACAGV